MESPEAQAALLSAGCAACGIAEVPVIVEPQPGQAARAPMPTMPDFTLGGPPSTLGGGPSRPNPSSPFHARFSSQFPGTCLGVSSKSGALNGGCSPRLVCKAHAAAV